MYVHTVVKGKIEVVFTKDHTHELSFVATVFHQKPRLLAKQIYYYENLGLPHKAVQNILKREENFIEISQKKN